MNTTQRRGADRTARASSSRSPIRSIRRTVTAVVTMTVLIATTVIVPASVGAAPRDPAVPVTILTNADFRYGTYIIDQPGTYRLGEDISFNPNSPDTLNAAIADGLDPSTVGLTAPVDAYQAGRPLFTQFAFGPQDPFAPGGLLDPRYDPAAYGIGFFAAISVTADDVVINLAGHTIEQAAEHALLQRFFAVIELADQPFMPSQGPFDFGSGIDAAHRVTIRNGVIGRSSHHGIHGNGNADISIIDVDFVGYEVAALALNGVDGLRVRHVNPTNRKDVPVLGTFSSAQFISAYLEDLLRRGSTTTIDVGGATLDVAHVRDELRAVINTVHADVITDGHGTIRPEHEPAYGLFHNAHGVVDWNSYSFLVNKLGVAVGGFPSVPDPSVAASDVAFENVRVIDQVAAINEVPALSANGRPATDPVGAVFQTLNRHPDSGEPVTIDPTGVYVGNPVANAQALVARAHLNGEFATSHLDVSRLNISAEILDWVEGGVSLQTAGLSHLCNGDSMFHVNKGVIAFRVDGAIGVRLVDTSIDGLSNLGEGGSTVCGDYGSGVSHPGASLHGYGGATVRGYSFAGSRSVTVRDASASDLTSLAGPALGVDVLRDSADITLTRLALVGLAAGSSPSPTPPGTAAGVRVGPEATEVVGHALCVTDLHGVEAATVVDESGAATLRTSAGGC